MKKLFAVIIIFTSCVLGQKSFTLEESLRIGLESSREIKIAASKLSASRARYDEYSSQLLPRLSAGGNYFWISEPPVEFQIPSLPGSAPAPKSSVNVFNGSVTLEQPLFTGLRLSSLKDAAEYESLAEEIQFNDSRNEKGLEIQTAFWNYHKAGNNLEIIRENLISLKQNMKVSEDFYENGLITKGDLLKLKVQVSAAELKLINAENGLELARMNFNRSIGIDLKSETSIEADSIPIDSLTGSYGDFLEEAMERRPELGEINYRLSAAGERIDAANASWYPQLSAFGSFNMLKVDGSSLPLKSDLAGFWVVGLNLNWNIWNWGNTSAKAAQAEELQIQTRLSLEMIREAIEAEVYKNYVALRSAGSKYELSLVRLRSAEENHRISKEKYNSNLLTASDLVESESDLLDARLELNNSVVDYHLAELNLKKAIGRKVY